MQQRALDRLVLPVNDHHLAGVTARSHVENGVVPLLGVQDAVDLLGIDRKVQRFQPGAIQHGGNQAALAQTAGIILAAALPRLGFYALVSLFCGCCSHALFLYKNSLLTEVSS